MSSSNTISSSTSKSGILDNNKKDNVLADNFTTTVDKRRVACSLQGMIVGDALAMPVHWFYSPIKMKEAYDGKVINGMMKPNRYHAESMVQGMSYHGTIDIMHDKAQYYKGATTTVSRRKNKALLLSSSDEEDEISKRRDDHGNYVGEIANKRIHYHGSLRKGQNTTNVCLARLLMRCITKSNANGSSSSSSRKKNNQNQFQDLYNPDVFMQQMVTYMTTPPTNNNDDLAQQKAHNDIYMDIYLRGFFTNASKGTLPLTACSLSQRDTWSIGSLDGVVLCIPIIATYSCLENNDVWYVIGRAIEQQMLTHRSITVTSSLTVVTKILYQLYRGSNLRITIEQIACTIHPPAITGRQIADSYVQHYGPGNIPKHEKWNQHMILDASETLMDLILRCLEWDNDEDVAGWRDRPNSRLSTACYCEHALCIVLYLAYKYHDNMEHALLVNARIGGHSTARGAVLGAILGAAIPASTTTTTTTNTTNATVPFFDDLCTPQAVQKEINDLIATLP